MAVRVDVSRAPGRTRTSDPRIRRPGHAVSDGLKRSVFDVIHAQLADPGLLWLPRNCTTTAPALNEASRERAFPTDEYLNLAIGSRATELTNADLSRAVRKFGVQTPVMPDAGEP